MDQQKLIRSLNLVLNQLEESGISSSEKVLKIDQILRYVVSYLSEKENLFLASYYAKISYLSNQFRIAGRDLYLIHFFRRLKFQKEGNLNDLHFKLGKYCLKVFIKQCLGQELGFEIDQSEFKTFHHSTRDDDAVFIPHLSVHINSFEAQEQVFKCTDSEGISIKVHINEHDEKKELSHFINELDQCQKLPIKVGLFNVQKKPNGLYPEYFVIEPDFLIDVTSVSEAFDAFGVSVAGYGLKKMIDKGSGIPLHVGNLANLMLDEMIYDPFISFNHFKNSIFQVNPLAFCSFTNDQVRQLLEIIKTHYNNLKKVIHEDFEKLGIHGKSVFVEPSFYAPRIGIQGRFDLLHGHDGVMNIIELKSGKTFRPNTYGLNNSHYHQTLLYDLILESNYGKNVKRNNFILYSSEADTPLRYAPTIKAEQREAIKVRNRIYLEEIRMQNTSTEQGYILKFIKEYGDRLSGFKGQDLSTLKKIYGKLSALEREYWESSFAFLSREYSLSKIGDELSESSKGLSSIWQMDADKKRDRHLLIGDLTINTDNSQADDPHILFDFTEDTAQLSNFRVGDIVILYPKNALRNDRLKSQIFKCTISQLGHDHVILRLRSKQMNEKAFAKSARWNVEHDILDSSFSKTFRQLYHFAKGLSEIRKKILGVDPPMKTDFSMQSEWKHATPTQQKIINDAITSQDYHLIWGPPGTGKTSVVLKSIIDHYYSNTQTKILVVAYTNRAVDEICEALQRIDNEMNYIRIGSKYSCGAKFKSRLLNTRLEKISNRKELKAMLQGTQIYIGTLASVIGKPELFDLLQFGVLLVDEASQILEASLAGLLTRAKKFILIGDHLQLPAIVLQPSERAKIQSSQMVKAGFQSYAESLFERLYRQCIDHKWTWAYSQLCEQGRMHEDIMAIVNKQFYNDSLKLLPGSERLTEKKNWHAQNDIQSDLIKKRLIYIPCPSNPASKSSKVNEQEAEIVLGIITEIKSIYENNNKSLHPESIGVITPYRAQISMIKSLLQKNELPTDMITIDTVERYQGSARDIIIMTTVVSSPFQLKALISENADGIDRKLNVAISRAREQFILVGNREILEFSEHYLGVMERGR